MLGRGHAEQLVPMIAALPGRGRAGRIAVALGPGSFTGLRVGLAAARALALAWGAELVGYPTLALIAAQALEHGRAAGLPPGPATAPAPSLTVATTGGHGEWFVQSFNGAGVPLGELASMTPDAAAAQLSADRVAGSQAEQLVARRGFGRALPLWPDARCFPLLSTALLSADAAPLYGRAPDARLPGDRPALALTVPF